MTLFDEYERADRSPSPASEDQFSFLNRSARTDAANIRAELERWFYRYPAEEQPELRSSSETHGTTCRRGGSTSMSCSPDSDPRSRSIPSWTM